LLRVGVKTASEAVWDVKFPKGPRYMPEFFAIEEQKQLEEAAKVSGGYDYAGIMLCLYAGLRIGEVCGLQYGDIDFVNGTLEVKRTIQRTANIDGKAKTKIVFLSPKSASSKRTIPLPEFLIQLLVENRQTSKCDFVLSSKGKPIEPRTLQYHFKRLCTTAGVKKVNFHTTRHSFAVRALESGFDVKSLSEIMGHSSAALTLKLYAHATDMQKRACMNALQSVFSEG
jgi:integrase